MNSAQKKCLGVFAIFAIIGFGPISPGCLIGMFVILRQPDWFLAFIESMYKDNRSNQHLVSLNQTVQISYARLKAFMVLLLLFILDIAPVPVTPVFAFAIILTRPVWFYQLVRNVYCQ